MKKTYVKVTRVQEVPEGQARSFEIGDERIVLCNVDGAIHAIEDVCTHDGSPFGNERLQGCAIECPRHGARFDVRDGAVLQMPAVAPVRTFPTKVVGDDLFVEIEED
jgi:3-phenylpropionate/trans-cinnamate dioxygenase ferredoxin subunit